eukprot:TRINITY_DN40767_c0_g1_i1.p1 TRINITY_DN40767_c0_g1~~TRINITY_DN40767_c0_g1_i1.p1  ORF type:complete len:1307 (-),score=299.52 TRINITY_DN40767_c0_g1_i1:215-3658(-)
MVEEVATRRFLVMCSFFEIYNEIICDLLNPVQDRSKIGAGLQVKEHPVLGIYVKDLQEIVATDAEGLIGLMDKGTKNRAVSCTNMNAVSSRSHSIFIIKVHQKDDEDKSKNVFAKLNLVDLAGSERQKGTGASGQTLKEGANINKSLSALGNVINALVDNANGKKVFVPFRNSKLTRVLQESLGGNSLTTMLAALSPAACNYEETVGTLRYANRAKAIKVSATKNEEASQISRLNAEIEELKKKLQSGAGGGGGGGSGMLADDERQEIRNKYEQQLKDMETMVNSTWEEKAKISKENEVQLSKALDEHKRQAKAMEEECRKRFRLLQEQNDLELSIRGLLDTVQSLPSSNEASCASSSCLPLRSGDLPRQWLKRASEISEVAQALKQEKTMALIFQGALQEDLRLWVDGQTASDYGMARAGARRGLTKLDTLRRECSKLSGFESQGQTRAQEFAAAVDGFAKEWANGGAESVAKELREAEEQEGNDEPRSPVRHEDGKVDEPVVPIYVSALEDIGRIMELVGRQATARANEFSSLSAMEVRTMTDLMLRGLSAAEGATIDPADVALIRSFSGSAEQGNAEPGTAVPACPREQRPIHEWTPEDADASVEGTEMTLLKVVALDSLNKKKTAQELLTRPPPKFVHDVSLLIREATGFLSGMSDDWPDPREGKLDLLQHISDAVVSALNITDLQFDPADVLKGKEVPLTLRLLQLAAIAGAKHKHQLSEPEQAKGQQVDAAVQASEMPKYLDALVRCIQRSLEHQEKLKAAMRPESGHGSPAKESDAGYLALQEKIEEEQQVRQRQEERLAALQEELRKTRATVSERTVQLEEAQRVASDADARKQGLRGQVEVLRSGLLQRATQMEASNTEVAQMRQALEESTTGLATKNAEKQRLSNDVKRQQQQKLETESAKETLEMDMKRMRLRLAEGLDEASKNVNEEILSLQAEKQKLDVKVTSLEEKLRIVSEADDIERKREQDLTEEKEIQGAKNDDFQMQLQVIVEERDALREGMDQLWQRKSLANEELENVTFGYTNLSDRLMEKVEEHRELEERLMEYENLRVMLLENMEKARNSPLLDMAASAPLPQSAKHNGNSGPTAQAPAPLAAVVASVPVANGAPRETGGGKAAPTGADETSSHYSDDFFEELDE